VRELFSARLKIARFVDTIVAVRLGDIPLDQVATALLS